MQGPDCSVDVGMGEGLDVRVLEEFSEETLDVNSFADWVGRMRMEDVFFRGVGSGVCEIWEHDVYGSEFFGAEVRWYSFLSFDCSCR